MKIQDVYNLILESKIGRFSGAGIVFFDGKKVLLLKKNNKRWVFPGGKPIQGETPKETAKRESQEEIGTCPGDIVAELMFEIDNRTFYSYVSKVQKPFDIEISDEHIDYTWIDYNKIKELKLHKNILFTVKRIVKKLEQLSVD